MDRGLREVPSRIVAHSLIPWRLFPSILKTPKYSKAFLASHSLGHSPHDLKKMHLPEIFPASCPEEFFLEWPDYLQGKRQSGFLK
jgi:hypothetical protein